MTVTVYTAPSCMACKQTMRHMDKRGIRYTQVPLDSDDRNFDAAHELDLKQAPVVCAHTDAGEQYWDGYRPDRIDALVGR